MHPKVEGTSRDGSCPSPKDSHKNYCQNVLDPLTPQPGCSSVTSVSLFHPPPPIRGIGCYKERSKSQMPPSKRD